MATHSEELKELLFRTDEEFRQLSITHSELESRLSELASKQYLSAPEQVEQVTLKKKKLALKDRMESILRRSREQESLPLSSAQLPSTH